MQNDDNLSTVQTRVDRELKARFHNWRRSQEQIPSISDALRVLLQKALDAEHAPTKT
jgi:antitoxin component of RelBE/YafQ-DinJ toxin-antitoxin module